MTDKEWLKALIDAQPEDATFDELMRELAFARLVERGLADARAGRVISSEAMAKRIGQWRT